MTKQILKLWHPDSPGMKVWVMRGWWARKFFSKDFATLGECEKYRLFDRHMQFHEELLAQVARDEILKEPLVYKRNPLGVVIV